MGAIIMPSTSLIAKLRRDYPQFTFKNAHVAHWSPLDRTVYIRPLRTLDDHITCLHELGHAIRGHKTYHQDIELLRCEREAWETARNVAPRYDIAIPDEMIAATLDTYRTWLHRRSRCPQCGHAAPQTRSLTYQCLLCDTSWTANDARQCGLKRYTKPPII